MVGNNVLSQNVDKCEHVVMNMHVQASFEEISGGKYI